MKKIYQLLAESSIFYVLIRFLIFLLVPRNTYDFLYYNITDSIFWIFISYILPFLASLLIATHLKNQKKLINFSKIYFPVLIIISLTGNFWNYYYWGYFLKRPTIFSQLKNANEILSITESSINKENHLFSYIDINPDYYYYSYERPIIAMLENWESRGNLLDYEKIYKSENLKLSNNEIKTIEYLIAKSNFLTKPEKGYEQFSNGINGIFIEFTTSKQKNTSILNLKEHQRKPELEYDKIYTYALINSGQLSNDHFARYEFLIHNNAIVRKQKFYYDVAGIEGLEYPTVAPILEVILILITFIFYTMYKLLKRKLSNI